MTTIKAPCFRVEENEVTATSPKQKSPRKISKTKRLTQSLPVHAVAGEDNDSFGEQRSEEVLKDGTDAKSVGDDSKEKDRGVPEEEPQTNEASYNETGISCTFEKSNDRSHVDHIEEDSVTSRMSWTECYVNAEFIKKSKSLKVSRKLKQDHLYRNVLTSNKGKSVEDHGSGADGTAADQITFSERNVKSSLSAVDQRDSSEKVIGGASVDQVAFNEWSSGIELADSDKLHYGSSEMVVGKKSVDQTAFSERSSDVKLAKPAENRSFAEVELSTQNKVHETAFNERSSNIRFKKSEDSRDSSAWKEFSDETTDSTSFSERSARTKLTAKRDRHDEYSEGTVDEKTADNTSFSERTTNSKLSKSGAQKDANAERIVDEKSIDITSFSERSANAKLTGRNDLQGENAEKSVESASADNTSFSERSTKAKFTKKSARQDDSIESTLDESAADSTAYSERSAAKLSRAGGHYDRNTEITIYEQPADSASFTERSAKAKLIKRDGRQEKGVERNVYVSSADNTSLSERSMEAWLAKEDHYNDDDIEKTVEEKPADSTSFSERSTKAKLTREHDQQGRIAEKGVDLKSTDSTGYSERSMKAKLSKIGHQEEANVEDTVDEKVTGSTSLSERSTKAMLTKGIHQDDSTEKAVDEKQVDGASYSERSASARIIAGADRHDDYSEKIVDVMMTDNTSHSERSIEAKLSKAGDQNVGKGESTLDEKAADSTSLSERSTKAKLTREHDQQGGNAEKGFDVKSTDSTGYSERSMKAKVSKIGRQEEANVEDTVDEKVTGSTSFSERSTKSRLTKGVHQDDSIEKAIVGKQVDSASYSERSASAKFTAKAGRHDDYYERSVDEMVTDNTSLSERSMEARLSKAGDQNAGKGESTLDEKTADSTSFSERSAIAKLTARRGGRQKENAERTVGDKVADSTSLTERSAKARLTKGGDRQISNIEKSVEEKAADSTSFSERSAKAELIGRNERQEDSFRKTVAVKSADSTSFSERSMKAKVSKADDQHAEDVENAFAERSVDSTAFSERSIRGKLAKGVDRQDYSTEKTVDEKSAGITSFSESPVKAKLARGVPQDENADRTVPENVSASTSHSERSMKARLARGGDVQDEHTEKAVDQKMAEDTSFSESSTRAALIAKGDRGDENAERTVDVRSADCTSLSERSMKAKVSKADDRHAEDVENALAEKSVDSTAFSERSIRGKLAKGGDLQDYRTEKTVEEKPAGTTSFSERSVRAKLARGISQDENSDRTVPENVSASTSHSERSMKARLARGGDVRDEHTDKAVNQKMAESASFSESSTRAALIAKGNRADENAERTVGVRSADSTSLSERSVKAKLLRTGDQEGCGNAQKTVDERTADSTSYCELSRTADFSNDSKDDHTEKTSKETATDRTAFSERTSVGHIAKSSKDKDVASSMTPAIKSERISAESEALQAASKKKPLPENVKLARLTYSSVPQLPIIFSEEEGSTTDSDETSSVMFCLPLANTVKVAQTFAIAVSQPVSIKSKDGLSEEIAEGSKSAKKGQKADHVQELSLKGKVPAKKSKPLNIKYLSDETERLLRKKAKETEKGGEAVDSENDFALNKATENEAIYRAPEFRTKKQMVKCTEGDPITVKAYISACPEPSISVYHNEDLICANQAESLVKEGENLYSFTFSVNSVHVEDGGKLIMKAKNQLGSDEYGAFTMEIADCKPDDDDVYTLLVENMAGIDSCTFQVFVKDAGEDSKAQSRRRRILRNLHGSDVPSSDNETENRVQKKRRRIRRVVERPNPYAPRLTQQLIAPHFDSALADKDAVVGENVVMMVTMQGSPPPDVRFYRDGQLIVNDEKYEIRHEVLERIQYRHWLILKNVEKSETAEYACHAINPAGEAWCYSDLTVRRLDEVSVTDKAEEGSAEDDVEDKARRLKKDEQEVSEAETTTKRKKQKKQKPVDEAVASEGVDVKQHDEPPEKMSVSEESYKTEAYEDSAKSSREPSKKTSADSKNKDFAENEAEVPVSRTEAVAARMARAGEALEKERRRDVSAANEEVNKEQRRGKSDVKPGNETSNDVSSPAERDPSPVTSSKKKKSIPKALLIPAQISSRFGDPSVLRSEANMTASITAPENNAEVTSPMKQPHSATIAMKVTSAGRVRSTSSDRSEDEFTFSLQSDTREKTAEEASATLRLLGESKDKADLPPKHMKKAVEKKAEGEDLKDHVASGEAHQTDEKESTQVQYKRVVEAHDKEELELVAEKGAHVDSSAFDDFEETAEMTDVPEIVENVTRDDPTTRGPKTAETDERKKPSKIGSKTKKNKDDLQIMEEKKESISEANAQSVTEKDSGKTLEEGKPGKDRAGGTTELRTAVAESVKESRKVAKSNDEAKPSANEEGLKKTATATLVAKLSKQPEKGNVTRVFRTKSELSEEITGGAHERSHQDKEEMARTQREEYSQPQVSTEGHMGELLADVEEERKSVKKSKKKIAADGFSEKKSTKRQIGDLPENKTEELESIVEGEREPEKMENKDDVETVVLEDERGTMKRKEEEEEEEKTAAGTILKEPEEHPTENKTVEVRDDAEDLETLERSSRAKARKVRSAKKQTEKKAEKSIVDDKAAEDYKNDDQVEDFQRSEDLEKKSRFVTQAGEDHERNFAVESEKEAIKGRDTLALESSEESVLHGALNNVKSSKKKGRRQREVVHLKKDHEELELLETASAPSEEKANGNDERTGNLLLSTSFEHEEMLGRSESDHEFIKQREEKVVEKGLKKKASKSPRIKDEASNAENLEEFSEGAKGAESYVAEEPAVRGVARHEELFSPEMETRKRSDRKIDRTSISETVSDIAVKNTSAVITKPMKHRTIGKEEQPVVLTIELDGPTQDVKWTKNGEPIAISEKYEIVSDGTACKLIIKNADFDDAGLYEVDADGSKSFTNLHISGKPKIKPSTKKDVEVEQNENITLTVAFNCQDDVVATCFFNGALLRGDARVSIDVHSDSVTFRKRKATKDDSGEYIVKLSNEHGDSISIVWENPTDDGGSPITGYVIKKKEDGRRTFQKVAQVSGGKTSSTVDDLEFSTGYVLGVAAINKYGTGEAVETPVITTGSPFEAPQITEKPTISDVLSDGCILKWGKPTNDGGSPIYGYDAYLRKDAGEWEKINDELIFATRLAVGDLLQGVTYEFKIEAVNEAGLSSNSAIPSEPLFITPIEPPQTVISVPRITVTSADSVTVEWDAPE
ncbi:hypothetical protein GCK32_011364, partial [Trichostrongylus colubriformis]